MVEKGRKSVRMMIFKTV